MFRIDLKKFLGLKKFKKNVPWAYVISYLNPIPGRDERFVSRLTFIVNNFFPQNL